MAVVCLYATGIVVLYRVEAFFLCLCTVLAILCCVYGSGIVLELFYPKRIVVVCVYGTGIDFFLICIKGIFVLCVYNPGNIVFVCTVPVVLWSF